MNMNTSVNTSSSSYHDAFWMPYTPNRQFKAQPRLVASAQGVAYRTPDGREVLDGTSGLWCVGAGHCHPRIAQAMKRQIDTLDFASSFQVGHAGAFELAERIGALAPPGMDRVFLVNSGSEGIDTAMKMALAPQFEAIVHSLADAPGVVSIRNIGLAAGIELAPDAQGVGLRGARAQAAAFDCGVLTRAPADTLILAPPFVSTPHDIQRMADALRQAIEHTANTTTTTP